MAKKTKARRPKPGSPATAPTKPPERRPTRPAGGPFVAAVAALLLVTTVAFLPAFTADFVSWDDPNYVVNNRLLDDSAGLAEIWDPSSPALAQGGLQYYPLVFTSLWVEHQLWGNNPRGYHATNVLLHLANITLAVLVLRDLGLPPPLALGAAAVFALHPVQVGSVAWVSERKNVLSGLFYLLSFLLYLRHRRNNEWGPYAGSLVAFGAALLSKSQTATLPVVLFLCEWLVLPEARVARRLPLARVAERLAPMLLMALVAAAITSRIEQQVIAAYYDIPALAERPLVAANAAWFYLGKFLLPLGLSPLYPRWQIDLASPSWWIGIVAWAVVLGALWRWWRRLPALALWGAAMFLVSVAPALGLLRFAYQHRSLVADHFLYLSCLGGGIALAALAGRIAARGPTARRGVAAGALALCAFYAVRTHAEAGHWRNDFTFWKHVLAVNPDGYPPNINLARQYESKGDLAAAIPLYRRASEIRPANVFALERYVQAVRSARGEAAVVAVCTEKLAQGSPIGHLVRLQRARSYEALGQPDDARADYEEALRQTQRGSDPWRQARQALDRLG